MKDKIKEYIDELFENQEKTQSNLDLKSEILNNTLDKYDDLLLSGKNKEEAYKIAIGNIGDIDKLFVNDEITVKKTKKEKVRKSPLLLSISVFLYIISVVPPILFANTIRVADIGASLMFVLIGLATALIIYRAKGGNFKKIEEIEKKGIKNRGLCLALAIFMYVISVVPVIAFSGKGKQTIGVSLMFVLIGLATGLIIFVFDPKSNVTKEENEKKTEPWEKIVNVIALIIYLCVSFVTFAWHITWIIFIISEIIKKIIKIVGDENEDK